jgi:hypothetical protein
MNASTEQRIIQLLKYTVGVLFVFSAIAKIVPIEPFEKQLVDLGFASWSTTPWFSRAIIGFEAFLGFAFFQNNYIKKYITPATAALLFAFCVHLGYTIYLTGGSSGNCGCFGQLLPMTPIQALMKNIATFGLLYFIYKKHQDQQPASFTPIMIAFSIAFSALLIARPLKSYQTTSNNTSVVELSDTSSTSTTSILQEDSLNTAIENNPVIAAQNTTTPSTSTNTTHQNTSTNTTTKTVEQKLPSQVSIYHNFNVFSDGKKVNLDEGTKIVALLSLECEHCMETAKQIGELNKEKGLPPVYYLFWGNEGQLESFYAVAKYKFPHKIIEPQIFFPLLGDNTSPPRVSVLKEGNLVGDFNFETFNKEKLLKAIQ